MEHPVSRIDSVLCSRARGRASTSLSSFARRPARLGGLLACLALGALLGCKPNPAGKGPVAPTQILSVADAQAIVEAERAQHGIPAGEAKAPASVAEVLTILNLDQSERFAKTRDYLADLEGVDALVVRAMLEALWAEGQITIASLARERAKQKDAEATTRAEQLKLQPGDAALQERVDASKGEAARERRLRDALETLAQPHYDAAMSLALEVTRRNPERADGHAVLANLYRLKHDWVSFENHMQRAQASEAERAGVLYARAMERAVRLVDRPGARQQLEALLLEHPSLARAQAQLVILQDDVEGRHTQLQKLIAINPHHALAQLEGPAIEAEYQTAMALRGGAPQPSPAAPTTP